ncbi:hypothetical protein [Nocardioides sp. BYT-33-1]|uniref:hypothetical protein n=1 Tax=Nocardioides sp. BYT-33-1 TaxID=3416952 RepID=UPI003F534733
MPKIIGRLVGLIVPLILMGFAASATDGVLRWALLGWILFVGFVHLCSSVVRIEKEGAR